jgi:magnesium chelatase subunit D
MRDDQGFEKMKGNEFTYPVFPFTALVGQESLKLALIINAIHPGVMGVLIRGQKGTAKSTAARALANLLPPIKAVSGCQCHCDPDAPDHFLCEECRAKKEKKHKLDADVIKAPFVTLPINTTETSLVGSIDFEHALKTGEVRCQHGVLANAHRGILYIDEVNLLDDNLVDLLLDAAASGINIVEREGISYVHPSRFILIGTMNPEEGELRPQFLDRFGLCVQIDSESDIDKRVEILIRRNAFDEDPIAFCTKWSSEEKNLSKRIEEAAKRFRQIPVSEKSLDAIARICRSAGVAGHRADIIMAKTARAIAAYNGRTAINDFDIELAAFLALPHRARETFEDVMSGKNAKYASNNPGEQPQYETVHGTLHREELFPGAKRTRGRQEEDGREQLNMNRQERQSSSADDTCEDPNEATQHSTSYKNRIFPAGRIIPIRVKDIYRKCDTTSRKASGRRQKSLVPNKRGRYIRSTMHRESNDIALDATIRSAAPHQLHREKNSLAISIETHDIREKVRENKTSSLLIFVVDASGSMGTHLMTETKGAIIYLLLEAYEKRDKVCLIAFKGNSSELLLPATNSVELAKKRLEDLPTGGKTPLCAGLLHGYKIARDTMHRNKDITPLLIIITDGRANVGADPKYPQVGRNTGHIYEELYLVADSIHAETRLKSIVIDAEEKRTCTFGTARTLSERLNAKYIVLDEIRSGSIAKAVQGELIEQHPPRAGSI